MAALVGDDLRLVEEAIRRELDSPVTLIQEMGEYIAGAGGKRLRPMLLLLAARLAGRPRLPLRAPGLRGRAAPHRDPHPRRRGRSSPAPPRSPLGQRPVGRRRLRPGGRPPLLEVVRHARAGQRPGGDGDPGPGHGVDDRGRGLPARAQAERRAHRGRLHPHHHPEDGVVHLRLLPDRRTAGGYRRRRRWRRSRATGSTWGWPSRSPTTRSTSWPTRRDWARRSGPICARASARCRSSPC